MIGNRVALIGAGRIAHTHLDALKNTPGVVVSAIIDPNLTAAEAMGAMARRLLPRSMRRLLQRLLTARMYWCRPICTHPLADKYWAQAFPASWKSLWA
jgi:hypothetical protein